MTLKQLVAKLRKNVVSPPSDYCSVCGSETTNGKSLSDGSIVCPDCFNEAKGLLGYSPTKSEVKGFIDLGYVLVSGNVRFYYDPSDTEFPYVVGAQRYRNFNQAFGDDRLDWLSVYKNCKISVDGFGYLICK